MAASAEELKGYVHEFLEPPPGDLICLICLCVARDPQQINCCGKVLCKECLREHKEHSNNCPQCRKRIKSFADKRSERDILSLTTLCDNKSNGCEWFGALRSLDEHLSSCGFTLLPCPNKCQYEGNRVLLLRRDLQIHTEEECPRRKYKCPHCQEEGEYQERTTEHLNVCPIKEVPCPKLGCRMHIARCKLSKHRKECMFEIVPCKYAIIGCKTEILRKDLTEHEGKTQQHLQLAIDTVCQQQITIREQERMLAQLPSRWTSMKFIVTEYEHLKDIEDGIYSLAFYTSKMGYKMCIRVYANGDENSKGTRVSVYAYLMKGENDNYLPWPFTGKITVELLNQLEDKNHYSKTMAFPSDNEVSQQVLKGERASRGWGYLSFISHSNLGYDAATNCQYLKGDRLHFRISADAKESSTPWLI